MFGYSRVNKTHIHTRSKTHVHTSTYLHTQNEKKGGGLWRYADSSHARTHTETHTRAPTHLPDTQNTHTHTNTHVHTHTYTYTHTHVITCETRWRDLCVNVMCEIVRPLCVRHRQVPCVCRGNGRMRIETRKRMDKTENETAGKHVWILILTS